MDVSRIKLIKAEYKLLHRDIVRQLQYLTGVQLTAGTQRDLQKELIFSGSCLYNSYNSVPKTKESDVDLFFLTQRRYEAFDEMAKNVVSPKPIDQGVFAPDKDDGLNDNVIYKGRHAYTLKSPPLIPKVDFAFSHLLLKKIYRRPTDFISDFDFVHTQFAYNVYEDKLSISKEAIKCIEGKILRMNPKWVRAYEEFYEMEPNSEFVIWKELQFATRYIKFISRKMVPTDLTMEFHKMLLKRMKERAKVT